MKQAILYVFAAFWPAGVQAQGVWTMQRCMRYAVEHNHEVRRAELELDKYKADRTGAVGRLLPEVTAGVGAQYNFGRAIDPETNVYTDVSTFHNRYSLSASLPVFDGFSRLHALKAAKASVLMGHQAFRQKQNQVALSVLQAFVNVVYYEGLVKMAREKRAETALLLQQTRVMEEVGRKSATDVAQVESQQAEADYELTSQQHLLASALLELKKAMAFPLRDSLRIENIPTVGTLCSQGGTVMFPAWDYSSGLELSPELQAVRYQMLASKHEWRQARAAFFPTLSLSAGLNTAFNHTLHAGTSQPFHSQFKNNMGEYVGATLSIPLFNRLQTVTSIRRARDNYRIACENYAQKRLELEKLSREAWQDWQGYLKQTQQMEHKVEADSMAYRLTHRQFEEGLATAIDLHTTSSQLLKSKATLLQCRLMAIVKEQLVRYYNGEQIWTE